MVAERFCQQMDKTPAAMLDYLKSRGCKIGGVTQGERGVLWYDESGEVRTLSALPVPAARVRDTSGAGDVFHGAYVYSYLQNPFKGWAEHLRFAQHAAAYKIQHLGNEAGLPTLEAIKEVAPRVRSGFGRRAPAGARKRRRDVAAAADRTQAPPAIPAIAAASSDARSPCPAR